ncbi:hypothetical protein [Alteribacter aurantiacus]|uniref:hypothetical protein n=1 Tax=Alteribacter aurantiacus TaxID=254410 RepID=UPI000428F84C|nr:hypothetical protein [Alteribacter aurantiacus]
MERRKWNKVQVIAFLSSFSSISFLLWLASRDVAYSEQFFENYGPFVLFIGLVMFVSVFVMILAEMAKKHGGVNGQAIAGTVFFIMAVFGLWLFINR